MPTRPTTKTGNTATDKVIRDAASARDASVIDGVSRPATPRPAAKRPARKSETVDLPEANGNGKPASTRRAKADSSAEANGNGNGTAKADGAAKPDKRQHKQELARRVVTAISGLDDLNADEQQIVSNWVHHLPTGHVDGEGSDRWWVPSLPRPVRSDWA